MIRRKLMAIDERDRYELFQDYIDELLQAELDAEEKASKEAQQKVTQLLSKLAVKEPSPADMLSDSSDSERDTNEAAKNK